MPDLGAAKALIRRCIDIDARNAYGFTALDVALMNGSVEMTRLLLDAGADARGVLESLASLGDDLRRILTIWAERHGVNLPASNSL